MKRSLIHLAEAIPLTLLLVIFRLLPLDAASFVGGAIARNFGPRLRQHRHARRQLELALPGKSDEEYQQILQKMWDNLGRIVAEMPHLKRRLMRKRMEIKGEEHIQKIVEQELPALFVSAHYGNWELAPKTAKECGLPLVLVYRHANNPYLEKVIRYYRSANHHGLFAKGKGGAMKLVRAIKSGKSIGMLIDQRMNDGMAVPFFFRDAMTATTSAILALKHQLPVIPARVIRKGGAHFCIEIEPPRFYQKTDASLEDDTLRVLTDMNQILEGWITEYPEQWFWVHRRWGKNID
jgi:KDO2-lipid IV(A) lauroyltransferase